MTKNQQRALLCRCGRLDLRARGLCATCYVLQHQDTLYFGGLREAVLERDGRRCRVCATPGGEKWSLAVHHRIPGVSEMQALITLCLGDHARVTRTRVMNRRWDRLLIELWREQHPNAPEQMLFSFRPRPLPQPVPMLLFPDLQSDSTQTAPIGGLAA